MIDRLDSEALRAYLRERSDLIDAPDESCSTLEDMLPADLAAEAARYRAADVPEADSSEDVDERPAPATTERLALLGQIRDLYPNLPPSRHIGVVHWLLEGTVLIERVSVSSSVRPMTARAETVAPISTDTGSTSRRTATSCRRSSA